MSKITLAFMQRFMGKLDTAIRNYVENQIGNKQNAPTLKYVQMPIGETSVTFTDIPTTGTVMCEVYTSKTGLDYLSIDDSISGTLTVNYEEQDEVITVYLKIEVY